MWFLTDHLMCLPTFSHTWSSWSPPSHVCICSHVTLARSPLSPLLFPSFPSAVHHVFTNSSLQCSIFLSCLYIFGSSRGNICSGGFSATCVLPGLPACTCCSRSGAMPLAAEEGWATLSSPSGTPSVLSALPHHWHFVILVGVKYLWDFYFFERLGKNSLAASACGAGRQTRRQAATAIAELQFPRKPC